MSLYRMRDETEVGALLEAQRDTNISVRQENRYEGVEREQGQ